MLLGKNKKVMFVLSTELKERNKTDHVNSMVNQTS